MTTKESSQLKKIQPKLDISKTNPNIVQSQEPAATLHKAKAATGLGKPTSKKTEIAAGGLTEVMQKKTSSATALHKTAIHPASALSGFLSFVPYSLHDGEAYMNAKQLEHFRGILNQWKVKLMEEVDSTVIHMQEQAIPYADLVDRAAQEEGFNLELRTRDRERKLIKKIEQSLDDIKNNIYGYCEDCGAEIGVRRLEARPTATKCIDCKTFEEIREKQEGMV